MPSVTTSNRVFTQIELLQPQVLRYSWTIFQPCLSRGNIHPLSRQITKYNSLLGGSCKQSLGRQGRQLVYQPTVNNARAVEESSLKAP